MLTAATAGLRTNLAFLANKNYNFDDDEYQKHNKDNREFFVANLYWFSFFCVTNDCKILSLAEGRRHERFPPYACKNLSTAYLHFIPASGYFSQSIVQCAITSVGLPNVFFLVLLIELIFFH